MLNNDEPCESLNVSLLQWAECSSFRKAWNGRFHLPFLNDGPVKCVRLFFQGATLWKMRRILAKNTGKLYLLLPFGWMRKYICARAFVCFYYRRFGFGTNPWAVSVCLRACEVRSAGCLLCQRENNEGKRERDRERDVGMLVKERSNKEKKEEEKRLLKKGGCFMLSFEKREKSFRSISLFG